MLLLLRPALAGNNFQPFPPCSLQTSACRQSVPEVVRVTVVKLKLLLCEIVISFPPPYEILIFPKSGSCSSLWLGTADSWGFILIRRELSEQCLAPFPGCLLLLFPLQIVCNKWVLPLLSLCSSPCRISHIATMKGAQFISGCYPLQITDEATGQSREAANHTVFAVS